MGLARPFCIGPSIHARLQLHGHGVTIARAHFATTSTIEDEHYLACRRPKHATQFHMYRIPGGGYATPSILLAAAW